LSETAVLIRLHVKPEYTDAFREHTLKLVRAARAEPGCRSIQMLQKQEEPAQFVLLEAWADKDYYLSDVHQQSPHMLAYFEATKSMLVDVGVEILSPVADLPQAVAHDDAA
jgi:quinol monooxygenase YgiN